MKRNLLLLISLFFLSVSVQAQFSAGLNATYHVFYGSDSVFATENIGDFPEMYGGELRGTYGINYKMALKAGLMYRTNGTNNYRYGMPATATDIGLDLKLHYYFLGDYNASNGGVYGIAGVSGHLFNFNWDRERVETINASDLVYFDDLSVLRVHGNLGLGMEAAIGPTYLFVEGQWAFLMNHFVNGTTIYSIPQRDFWSVSLGVRVPFGAMSEGW